MSLFIQYTPSLMKKLGSDRSAILFERLEYWFKRYSSGFYKFITACQHPCYRNGDSWEEELGFSRNIFNNAFDRIGIRYKSKTDFESQQDPFKGKYFVMYMDRQSHRTFFVRNHRAIESLLNHVMRSPHPVEKKSTHQNPSSPAVSELPHLFNSRNSIKHQSNKYRLQKITSSSFEKDNEILNKQKKNQNLTPSTTPKRTQLEKSKSTTGKNHKECQTTYLFSKNKLCEIQSTEKLPEENNFEKGISVNTIVDQVEPIQNTNDISSKMLHIWITFIGEVGGNLSPRGRAMQQRLTSVLVQSFNGSLNMWRSYCQKIASSKFLMGERGNQSFKKAWLLWAIKPDSIDKIQNGDFVLNDRVIPESEVVRQLKHTIYDLRKQQESINTMLNELWLDQTKMLQRCVRELKSNLEPEQLDELKHQFIEYLQQQKPNLYSEFQNHGWQGFCIDITFDLFLQEVLNRIDPLAHQKIQKMIDQKQISLKAQFSQLLEQERVIMEQLAMEFTLANDTSEEIALCA